MVDRANLAEINDLYRRFGQLEQAIHNLDHNGHIGSMVVVGETPDVPSAVCSTIDWPYPPQMVEGIKQIARQKEQEIIDRLKELGITGIAETPEPATDRRRK